MRFSPIAIALVAYAVALPAQTPISRAAAIQTAVERGARSAVARADTAAAFAELLAARVYPNPVLSASYSKSVPQYHATTEIPLDYLWQRDTRVRGAEAGRQASRYRLVLTRATIALDADTTYTRALAAIALSELSRHNALAADSLRRMSIARRDAGDASDLDVELATVNVGRQTNVAAADSLAVVSALLDLQEVMGVGADGVAFLPTDSLTTPPSSFSVYSGEPLPVAAASASLDAAQLAVRLQRRSLWTSASVFFGFETHDPTGSETGILPTFGVTVPLPFLDRNRGGVARAVAEQERATAELELARVEARTLIARASRERTNALARVERDRTLVTSANRVVAMSMTAYREGAFTLPNVLEAQREARDALAQYIQDLAAAWIATAALRTYTLTPSTVR